LEDIYFHATRAIIGYLDAFAVMIIGTVHKVRHARRGGGPRRCDSLWQGEESRWCDVKLI